MRKKKHGVCELCLKYNKLVDSHIIPKSFYIDPNLKHERLTTVFSEASKKKSRKLIGIYDQFLCDTCEKKFQLYDDLGYQILYKDKQKEITVQDPLHPNRSIKMYENIGRVNKDIKSIMKMFILSILWRGTVSKREEFQSVNLGSYYNEQARKAIINHNVDIFVGIDIVFSKFENGINSFIFPVRDKYCGVNGYRIFLPYYTLLVKIDRRPFPKALSDVSLNTINTIMAIDRNWHGSAEHLTMRQIITKPMVEDRFLGVSNIRLI